MVEVPGIELPAERLDHRLARRVGGHRLARGRRGEPDPRPLERDRVWFPSAPPSAEMPPDAPSQPVVEALGRQFNAFHFRHPILGYALATPSSDIGRGEA